jgi:hypothetical protein
MVEGLKIGDDEGFGSCLKRPYLAYPPRQVSRRERHDIKRRHDRRRREILDNDLRLRVYGLGFRV